MIQHVPNPTATMLNTCNARVVLISSLLDLTSRLTTMMHRRGRRLEIHSILHEFWPDERSDLGQIEFQSSDRRRRKRVDERGSTRHRLFRGFERMRLVKGVVRVNIG